jgi:Tfp pilus assembly protein PilV
MSSRLRGDDGFGLIEVLVAFVLLMTVTIPSSLLLGDVLAQTSTNRASVAAGQLAEQALESAHGVLSSAMTGSCDEQMPCTVVLADQVVDHITYHTKLHFEWALIGNASADVCTSLVVPQVASATATVSWGPGLHSLSESSIVNLPYTPTNLNDGFLAVQVNGVTNRASAGQPANFGQPGVVVTVTSDGGTNVTFPVTDSHGCAFAAVPANLSTSCPASAPTCTNYTITLSPPADASTAYVDQQLNTSPSANVTLAPTQVTGPPLFTYDRAALITLVYPSVTGVEGGVTCPLPTLCVASGQSPSPNPSRSLFAGTYADQTGADNGSPSGGLAYDAAGPLTSSAVAFDGSTGYVQTANPITNPQTLSLAAWFKTTSSGSILGFSNQQAASGQTNWDRQIWIDAAGHVVFGVYPGSVQEVASPGTYTDNRWHFVVAEISSAGMSLSLDGSPVAANPSVTSAQAYDGWWHLGWSNAAQGWADAPTSNYFAGSLAQVATFPNALSSSQISTLATAPTAAAYATAVTADGPSSFYPLNASIQSGLAATTPTASLLSYDGSTWSSIAPPTGLARLESLVCPSTTTCEGVGTTSSNMGMLVSATLSGGNWTFSGWPTTPGTNLSSISCPSTTECLAAGYSMSGATRTGLLLSFDGQSWSTVATSGVTILNSIACPTSSACILVGANGGTPELFTFAPTVAPAQPSFNAVTLSSAPSGLSAVTCPAHSGSTPTCFVTGTTASGASAWSTNDLGTTWTPVGSIAAGYSSLGTPVCTSSSACLIPANSTSTDTGTVLSLSPVSGTPPTWTAAAAPASFPPGQWVAAVDCRSGTCFAAGQAPTASGATVPLLADTTDGSTWTSIAVPGSTDQVALTGVACGSFGCVAVGESPGSDTVYSTSGGAWTADTDPDSGPGIVGLGFSASVGNSLLSGGVRQVVASRAGVNPGALGIPLYPFVNGYSVFPGSCLAQASTALPTTAPGPGASATALARLANTSLDIVNAAGQPVAGATVTATVTGTTPVAPATTAPMQGCTTDTYSLPTTGGDGLSTAGFPLGVYTLTVNGTAVTNPITISNGAVTYNSMTYPQPASVPIVVNLP